MGTQWVLAAHVLGIIIMYRSAIELVSEGFSFHAGSHNQRFRVSASILLSHACGIDPLSPAGGCVRTS